LIDIELNEAIERIASDNTSGASEIMRAAGAVCSLLKARNVDKELDVIQARNAILQVGVALICAQPEMSPLLRLASAALSAAKSSTASLEAFHSAEKAALLFIEQSREAAHDSAVNAAGIIHDGMKVLTHSRSSTVLEALLEARRKKKDFTVFATESRPLFEGRTLAASLADNGVSVTLIADAAAPLVIDRSDLVLVGADQLTPQCLVNKIGTRMIALAAREKQVPVYAACDSSKFISEDYCVRLKRDYRPTRELWEQPPAGVEIANLYFEPVPLTLLNAIITESGALSIDQASRCAEAASIDDELAEALKPEIK